MFTRKPLVIYFSRVMKYISLGLRCLLAVAISSLSSPGAFAREAPPKADVLRATLTNGLRVIIVRNTLAPVVTTIVNYRVGSDECPAGFPGTAHALEHMMFRGSPGCPPINWPTSPPPWAAIPTPTRSRRSRSISSPCRSRTWTWRCTSRPSGCGGLLDSEPLWDKERGAIEQEVAQDLSNPEYVFYMKLLEAMFKGTPYAHDALGTRPSFDKTTGAMLRNFHHTWYAPNNAILIIVGDVQPAQALAQVKALFGELPAGKLPARPEFHFAPVEAQTLKLDTDLPYGMAAITFRFPGSDSPDYAAAQVLADVLSSQRGKLYGLVPEGKALGAAFSYDSLPKAGLGYAVAEFPAGADAAALVDQMRAILDGGGDQRGPGRPGRGGQAPRSRERRTSEELHLRPRHGMGAGGGGRGPRIAGR